MLLPPSPTGARSLGFSGVTQVGTGREKYDLGVHSRSKLGSVCHRFRKEQGPKEKRGAGGGLSDSRGRVPR